MGNQFGICEWVFPVRGVEAVRWAHRLGYDGIQITELGGYEAGYPLLDAGVQDTYRQAVEDTGIQLQALHLWSLCRLACMIHPLDGAAGKIAKDYLKKSIEICAQMRIPKLMVTSGFLCQIKNKKDLETFSAYLKYACDIAEDHGVTIVFESALTLPELEWMFEATEHKLKICYDTFNPIRFALAHPAEEIAQIPVERIDHFHLKDGPMDMVGCSLLGEGCGAFLQVAQTIKAKNYSGWFITENYYDAYPLQGTETFDALAMRDLAAMRSALG